MPTRPRSHSGILTQPSHAPAAKRHSSQFVQIAGENTCKHPWCNPLQRGSFALLRMTEGNVILRTGRVRSCLSPCFPPLIDYP